MTDPITCPQCHEQLDIPAEFRGRPVRCGNCQNVFTAESAAPPVVTRRPSRVPVEDERDNRPRFNDRPPRRSNAGVWMLLLVTLFVFGGCCGGFNVIMVYAVNPKFTPYTSAEGKFKVEFPGKNPTEGPTKNPADRDITGVEVTADREFGQEHYLIKTYAISKEWQNLPAEEALKKVADAELKALDAPPNRKPEVDVKHDNFPAIDIFATEQEPPFPGRCLLMRCVLAGDRVYVIAVQAQNIEPQQWWLRKFFVSFEILDPPPKPVPAEKE